MPSTGNSFRDAVVKHIKDWNEPIEVLTEINVGWRISGKVRKIDILLRNKENNKFLGIECKIQDSSGSAEEKLVFALEDCFATPIPAVIVFSGKAFDPGLKAKLRASGRGIEVAFDAASGIVSDDKNLFRQRCYIELGLNWLPFATGDKAKSQLKTYGYAP